MGLLTAALLAPGTSADPAAAKITHAGIAGVDVGMNENAVRDKLGTPSSTSGDEGGGTMRLEYRRRKLEVLLRGDAVIRVRTTSRSQRTAAGVGPGISQAAMMRKLRGERCGTALGARVCWVLDGSTVMTFVCRRGRVMRAEVARAET